MNTVESTYNVSLWQTQSSYLTSQRLSFHNEGGNDICLFSKGELSEIMQEKQLKLARCPIVDVVLSRYW